MTLNLPLYSGALATSPIQTLPVELLSYVLELATHATSRKNPDSEYSFDAGGVKAPLVYSTVCRHWRIVALGTPSLWTSLCVTIGNLEDDEHADDSQNSKQVLDTTHLDTYLRLSRKCSIDILIDARDPYWDFCEPEIPSTCDRHRIDGFDSDPSSTFSLTAIQTISSILLPHLSRWRSLEILTDTWLPMQSFLSRINVSLIEFGAPKLEYLTLMRCNDFISHSPWFEPREGKGMAFLSQPSQREEYTHPSHSTHRYKLPGLRSLVLRGVHADWDELGEAIGTDLEALDLSSHSNDVRPTLPQIRNMLKKSASLTKLVISGSGVVFSSSPEAPVMKSSDDYSSNANLGTTRGSASAGHSRAYSPSLIDPLHLPHLHTLQLGYRSHFSNASLLGVDATNFLSILKAPTLCNLKLEDTSHPGDEEYIDAGELLGIIASGNEPSSPGTRNRAASWSEGVPVQPAPQRKFPALQKLTLKGVKASQESFRNFFWRVDGFSGPSPSGVGGLRELQLVGAQVLGHVGGMDILAALASSTHSHFGSFDSFRFSSTSSSPPRRFSELHAFPYPVQPMQNHLVQHISSSYPSQPLHPCPNLQNLLICPNGPVVPNDFEFLIHRVISSRSGRLTTVDVRLTEDSLYGTRQQYTSGAGVKLTSVVSNIMDALLVTADSLKKAAVQDDASTGTGELGDDDSSRAVGTWLVHETGRDIELLSSKTSSTQGSRPLFTQRGTLLRVFKPNPILYSSYDAKLAEAEAEAEAYRHCGIPNPYDDDDDGSIPDGLSI